jgi:NAD(P)-dependent dehydrogenase (short-subunit alcohol dehydrogenase family)
VAGHLDAVIEKAGGVDISFNAVGLRNTTLQGVPLVDLEVEDFMRPITEHMRANFLTARLAGRHMTAKGSGVIMTVTSIPSRIANPLLGGVAVAMAAEEALIRDLSVEFAPHGVRVAGVRMQGMPTAARSKRSSAFMPRRMASPASSSSTWSRSELTASACQLFRKWPRSWRSSPYPPEIPNHYYGDPRS